MIKFVYFDVGGVLELDFSKTNKFDLFKQELGVKPEDQVRFDDYWDEIEANGLCTTRTLDSYLPELKEKFGIVLPNGYSLLNDGFVSKFDYNKYIWPVVEEIRGKCKIGLLTNMYPQLLEATIAKGLLRSDKWDAIVSSAEVGIQKPNSQIYQIAQEKTGVNINEILFVDNTKKHLEAGAEFGWNIFQYDPSSPEESSKKLLEHYLSLQK